MLFCQQCGAENTANARFCNMCGAQIASAGEPGGPLPAKPSKTKSATDETLPGHDVSSEAKAEADPARTVHGHAGADLAIAPPSETGGAATGKTTKSKEPKSKEPGTETTRTPSK